jgi:hypothetical protein
VTLLRVAPERQRHADHNSPRLCAGWEFRGISSNGAGIRRTALVRAGRAGAATPESTQHQLPKCRIHDSRINRRMPADRPGQHRQESVDDELDAERAGNVTVDIRGYARVAAHGLGEDALDLLYGDEATASSE